MALGRLAKAIPEENASPERKADAWEQSSLTHKLVVLRYGKSFVPLIYLRSFSVILARRFLGTRYEATLGSVCCKSSCAPQRGSKLL